MDVDKTFNLLPMLKQNWGKINNKPASQTIYACQIFLLNIRSFSLICKHAREKNEELDIN